MPYLSGCLYIVVMSFVPGEQTSVLWQHQEVSNQDRDTMRLQVTHTWEYETIHWFCRDAWKVI